MDGSRLKGFVAVVLSFALLAEGSLAPAAHAAPLRATDLPDLTIAQFALHPSSAKAWEPVTAEVVVQNGGAPSPATTVSLTWCCGSVERPLPALATGESTAMLFEHALVFPEAGDYTVMATVDAPGLVAEADEANNSQDKTLAVTLPGQASETSATAEWGTVRNDSVIPLSCPDTPLMRIGRKEPYVLADRCPSEWGRQENQGCPVPDRDGDGVPEGPDWLSPLDRCPDEPGPPYFQGCPLPDADGDGIADAEDACPAAPGPRHAPTPGKPTGAKGLEPAGAEAEPPAAGLGAGCPAPGRMGDRDGDGVADAVDACPDEWGPQDTGCPYPATTAADPDGDGFAGAADGCPDVWGPGNNGGCPRQPDSDGDTLYDAYDNCPHKPGPGNGCPPSGEEYDPDADGLGATLARPNDSCKYGDDQAQDAGCQVYLRGQEENACGTTSLAYVMRYFGKACCGDACTPQCIDSDIRAPHAPGLPPMYTDPIALKEYAEAAGLHAEVYVDRDVEDIRWFVERDIPVLLDIINVPGSANVDNGHWVVAISVCQAPDPAAPGVTQTLVGIYDPVSKQYAVTPDVLERYWHDVELQRVITIPLWSHLFVAVSDQPLPPGNSDQVRTQLALAQGAATAVTGWQDLSDVFVEADVQRLLESLVELPGGAVTAVLGLVFTGMAALDGVPLIGGMLGAVGNLGGTLTLVTEDIVNCVADLLNPDNWTAEKLGEILGDLVGAIGDAVWATFEGCWDFITEGIGGLLKSIWSGVKGIGCSLFDWGCPETYAYFKHYASSDPCLESTLFANGLWRERPLGYIYTQPVPGTHPVYLFASGASPEERSYLLCEGSSCAAAAPAFSLGVVGYALDATTGQDIDLAREAAGVGMPYADASSHGYLLPQPTDGTTLLWLLKSVANGAYTVSTDSCAGTETFFTPVAEGYTREVAVGLISPGELAGGARLYRFFNPETSDCLLSTDEAAAPAGYLNQGYLGHIYTSQAPGTVPLYQLEDQAHHDHLVTTDPGRERLPGYGAQEMLGYVLPAATPPGGPACAVPLWRFCRREWAEK